MIIILICAPLRLCNDLKSLIKLRQSLARALAPVARIASATVTAFARSKSSFALIYLIIIPQN